MRKLLLFAVAVAVLALAPPAMADPKPDHFTFETLSSRADTVSGGDTLVAVNVPSSLKLKKVKILLGGTDVTSKFSSDPDDPNRLVALLDGLALGANTLVADSNGEGKGRPHDELVLVNHAITGPVFSGPHQSPFICRTGEAANGLGAPLDTNCSAPTRVDWFYRSNVTNTFKPLANPTDRPADLAQTTTRDGETVDYVVRMESGTINRAVYRWAVLAAGGETGNGWNRRLVYEYGGGCGPGYHQGTLAQGGVLDNAVLSQGFAKASSSLTEFAAACNDVLSAETTSMVKERLIEQLGEPPVWTMGWGGSGGAIQQNMIAQNYPGLLDGIVPALTFQDAQLGEPVDCRLINRYFAGSGAPLTTAQRRAIHGYISPFTCPAWDSAFANVIVASLGCNSIVPPADPLQRRDEPDGRPLHDVGQHGERLRPRSRDRVRAADARQRRRPVRPQGAAGGRHHGGPLPRPEREDRRLRQRRQPACGARRRGSGGAGDRVPHRSREPGRRRTARRADPRSAPVLGQRRRHPHVHPLVHHARAVARGARLGGQPGDVAGRGWRHGTHDRRRALADGGLARCDRGRRLRPPAVREGGGGEAGDRRGRLLDRRRRCGSTTRPRWTAPGRAPCSTRRRAHLACEPGRRSTRWR